MNAPTPSTDAEAVQRIARAAARRLAGGKDPRIENDVEALLQTVDSTEATSDQYFVDPISLSALIVSAAALGWTTSGPSKGNTGPIHRSDYSSSQTRIDCRQTDLELRPRPSNRRGCRGTYYPFARLITTSLHSAQMPAPCRTDRSRCRSGPLARWPAGTDRAQHRGGGGGHRSTACIRRQDLMASVPRRGRGGPGRDTA